MVGRVLGFAWLAFWLWARATQGQVPLRTQVALAPQAGFLWQHNDEIKHLGCHPVGLWASVAPARWAAAPGLGAYANGRFGLSVGWLNFRRAELGHALPVLVYFENAAPATRTWSLFYRISAGVTWLSAPFELDRNPLNTAYSAPLTWAMQGRIGFERRTSGGFWQVGANLTHFSNGGFRLPNLGLNLPAAFVAYGLGIPTQRPYYAVADTAPLPSRHHLDVTAGFGGHSVQTWPARLYASGLGRLAYRYGYARNADLALGLDVIHQGSLAEARQVLGRPGAPIARLAITAGHEWYLSRQVALSTHLGYYLYNQLPVDKPFYQRYGFRFAARRKLSPAVWLRAHAGKADLIEYALTYTLPLKP